MVGSKVILHLAFILLFLGCDFCHNPGYAQGVFELKHNRTGLHFTFQRNLMVIPVMINNKGPYQFIFDSGVSFIIITNPALMQPLGISSTSSILIKGFGSGEAIKASLVNQLHIQIGKIKGENFSAAVLPKGSLDFSNYLGIPIDGIIGYDLLKDYVVTVDYANHWIEFSKIARSKSQKKFQILPLIIVNGRSFVHVISEINAGVKIPLNLILDTGGGNAVFLDIRSNDTLQIPSKNISADLGWGINGPITGKMARFERLNMGGIVMEKVVGAFPLFSDTSSISYKDNGNGNLGSEILRRFTMIIDYPNKKLFLKKRSNFKESFEYNMSGIGFTAVGDAYNQYLVSSIDPLSPGDEAGLKVGDQLFFIQDKIAQDFSVSELDALFRSKPGKEFKIVYLREGQIFQTSLKLKRRV